MINNATPETKLDGFAQQMNDLSSQLSTVYDISSDLRNAIGWYDDTDPIWGGPPSKKQLLAYATLLQQAYMNMAAITGLDPCEQFDDTKQRIRQSGEARVARK